jgi:hypothetical protein
MLATSVADPDPDPDPPDPVGPPGSFHHHVTTVRKTLIFTIFLTIFDFLSLKNDLNVPSIRNKQKNVFKKLVFCWHLEG